MPRAIAVVRCLNVLLDKLNNVANSAPVSIKIDFSKDIRHTRVYFSHPTQPRRNVLRALLKQAPFLQIKCTFEHIAAASDQDFSPQEEQ